MDAGVPKYDFDLNIPYTEEDMDSNENNTQGVTKTGEENGNNQVPLAEDNGNNQVPLVEDNGNNEVVPLAEDNGNNQVALVEDDTTSLENFSSEDSDSDSDSDDDDDDDDGEDEDVRPPLRFIDLLHVEGYQGVTMVGRRRYRRRGRAYPIDDTKICTNIRCKSRKTPMWRTGPLGSKTLCNACGIYYRKQMRWAERGTGTGRVSFEIIYEDGSDSNSTSSSDSE